MTLSATTHEIPKDHDSWLALLRRRGFRITPQRERILEIFEELPDGEHLSAESLQRALVSEGTDISLATLYRTLKLLASLGVLRELDFAEDHKHYELIKTELEEQHQHIICIDCGYTEEFASPEVFTIAQDIAAKTKFELIDNQLKLYGRCLSCQESPMSYGSSRQKKILSPHASKH